jgi:hypothetical protein
LAAGIAVTDDALDVDTAPRSRGHAQRVKHQRKFNDTGLAEAFS